MLTYPVDTTALWALLDTTTGNIISRNKPWPNLDGSDPGLDPNLVYLQHVTSPVPDYDSRLYYLRTVEEVDADANELRRTHEAVARSVEERTTAAENEEASRLDTLLRLERLEIDLVIMVGLLLHLTDGQQIPARFVQDVEEFKGKAMKVFKNRDRLKALIGEIQNDQDPDLDSGWEEGSA